jgi:hypothetical protein
LESFVEAYVLTTTVGLVDDVITQRQRRGCGLGSSIA